MTTPTPSALDALAERITSITTDWNGARMVDGEEPRIVPSCGELRAMAAAFIALSDRLAAVERELQWQQHWRKVLCDGLGIATDLGDSETLTAIRDCIRRVEDRAEAAEAALQRAVEALEPFAEFAAELNLIATADWIIDFGNRNNSKPPLAPEDFRRARAALKDAEERELMRRARSASPGQADPKVRP
jgi:hypothetical protein